MIKKLSFFGARLQVGVRDDALGFFLITSYADRVFAVVIDADFPEGELGRVIMDDVGAVGALLGRGKKDRDVAGIGGDFGKSDNLGVFLTAFENGLEVFFRLGCFFCILFTFSARLRQRFTCEFFPIGSVFFFRFKRLGYFYDAGALYLRVFE